MPEIQKRSEYRTFKIETREETLEDGSKKKVFKGYPILFNTETNVYDNWYGEVKEIILPTALDKTNLSDVFLVSGHNVEPDKVLGRTNVNMRVEVDEIGLFIECEVLDTQVSKDIYTLVEKGIVDGMSFGFLCFDEVNPETRVRTITQIDELYEVTITPFPAYKEASVIAQEKAKKKEDEDNKKAEASILEDNQKKLDELEELINE